MSVSALIVGAGVFGATLSDRPAEDEWMFTVVDSGGPRAASGDDTRVCASHTAELWRELNPDLLIPCGVAWFARRADGWEAASERSLRRLGIPVERLTPAAAAAGLSLPRRAPVSRLSFAHNW